MQDDSIHDSNDNANEWKIEMNDDYNSHNRKMLPWCFFFLFTWVFIYKMVVMINVWNFRMMWVLSLSLCHCHQHYLFMVVAIPLSRSKKTGDFKRWHLNFCDLMQPKWSKMKYVMMNFDVLFNRYAMKKINKCLKHIFFISHSRNNDFCILIIFLVLA